MTWPNFMLFKEGKFNPTKRRRFRNHDRFRKGAIAEFWPMQMDFIENTQQDSWWRTQTKYGEKAFKTPKVF